FFVYSRRRHTRSKRDWSSDVCSSDLGGGKGIRVARDEEDLIKGIRITRQEAETAFGNAGVYIEKYIEDFRHVEIQILADQHGNEIGRASCRERGQTEVEGETIREKTN